MSALYPRQNETLPNKVPVEFVESMIHALLEDLHELDSRIANKGYSLNIKDLSCLRVICIKFPGEPMIELQSTIFDSDLEILSRRFLLRT